MSESLDNLQAYLDNTAVDKGLKENFFPRHVFNTSPSRKISQ